MASAVVDALRAAIPLRMQLVLIVPLARRGARVSVGTTACTDTTMSYAPGRLTQSRRRSRRSPPTLPWGRSCGPRRQSSSPTRGRAPGRARRQRGRRRWVAGRPEKAATPRLPRRARGRERATLRPARAVGSMQGTRRTAPTGAGPRGSWPEAGAPRSRPAGCRETWPGARRETRHRRHSGRTRRPTAAASRGRQASSALALTAGRGHCGHVGRGGRFGHPDLLHCRGRAAGGAWRPEAGSRARRRRGLT